MSRTTTYKSSQEAWDGKGLVKIPIPKITNAAAAQYFSGFTAPFAMTVVGLFVTIHTVFTHADAALAFGTIADPDSHLDDYDLTDIAAGTYELSYNALMLSRDLAVNTGYSFSLAASDTTGVLTGMLICEPV